MQHEPPALGDSLRVGQASCDGAISTSESSPTPNLRLVDYYIGATQGNAAMRRGPGEDRTRARPGPAVLRRHAHDLAPAGVTDDWWDLESTSGQTEVGLIKGAIER